MVLFKPTLMNTPALNVLNDEDIVIYAKSGMTTTDPCYVGRPYGCVAVACKQRKNMQYTELDIMSDRIIGVKVCNNSILLKSYYVSICHFTTERLTRPTAMLKQLMCYRV